MSVNRIFLGVFLLLAAGGLGFFLGRSSVTWKRETWKAHVRQLIKSSLIVAGVLMIAIQAIPYGRAHANPPVLAEPDWDSAVTRDLAVLACFDCHSNETNWPWYSNVAPVSWLVQRDVDRGRATANWSEWGRHGDDDESSESAETVSDGSMPPLAFNILHPEARLTDEELDALEAGLAATFGTGSS